MLAVIVTPTYNEKANIKKLIPKIFAQKIPGVTFKLIVVDDNSPDGTAKEAKKFKNVQVISRPAKLGLGSAYVTGFGEAIKQKADVIFSMDADLSHNFEYAKDFIEQIKKGFDVVIGSRNVPGGGTNWPISRKFISRGASFLAQVILGVPAKDLTSGYRCYKARILKKALNREFKSTSYSFLEELIYYCHLEKAKITEIPIFFKDRTVGQSKLRKMEIVKFPFTLLRLRLSK
ncbi:MAG: polyprenol monophosphomannose synthase [Candidatus Diapherotrites archaeon]|jgi:dolichol-phosphate mannosyltransferase|nr:polyprenol monophosphomannose synthase [Candidatus Diapherotrites archaeon]MBT4597316.1 polyprenol monophosphomannose synthase [Candidatus Diapherotrites archaeon]